MLQELKYTFPLKKSRNQVFLHSTGLLIANHIAAKSSSIDTVRKNTVYNTSHARRQDSIKSH